MIAAIYARVSTDLQTTAQQLDRLRPFAPGALEFVDDDESGQLVHRPAFDGLTEAIGRGEVSAVYAVKLDRLSRSAKFLLGFFEDMEKRGVRVVLTDQALDTSTPLGKLLLVVLAGVAEFEADLISERTQVVMDAFKAGTRVPKGPIGRPRILTDEKVARIRELRYGQGLPWKTVAQHVGICAVTVRKVKPAPSTSRPHVLNNQNAPEGTGTLPPSPQGVRSERGSGP